MQNIIIKNNNFSINRISQIDNNFFTGYYDFCPFDDQNKLIICHKLNNIFEDPSFKNYIEVGFIDIKLKSFKSISETYAWNFQFGARPHWIKINNSNCIIFNNYKDKEIKAFIYDTDGNFIKMLNNSIFSWHELKKFGLTLNFKRLQKYRKGYGYNIYDEHVDSESITNDGITYFDLNNSELILSLEKIISHEKSNSYLDNVNHWVNHIQINPSGKKFAFMHRFLDKNKSFSTRLMLFCMNTKKLSCLYDNLYCSHYSWIDNENILAWCRKSKSTNFLKKNKKFAVLRSTLRKLLGSNIILRNSFLKDSFYRINIKKPKVLNSFFEINNLNDGHINCFPHGNKIIMDEYADINKFQPLSIYDTKSNNLTRLFSAKAEPNEVPKHINFTQSEYRCDLHANWSRNENMISFDSTHEGYRGVYLINL